MKKLRLKYLVTLETGDDGKWCGFVPDLPGVAVVGYRSPNRAVKALAKGIKLHLESMREDGVAIPEPSQLAEA